MAYTRSSRRVLVPVLNAFYKKHILKTDTDTLKVKKLCYSNNQKKTGVTITSGKINKPQDSVYYQRYKETFMIKGSVHQEDIIYMCLSQTYNHSWSL